MNDKKMLSVTTDTGFHCEIEEDALDDMELLEAVMDLENSEPVTKVTGFREVLELLLGEEQKKALYAHIKAEHGRVKPSVLKDMLLQIFTRLGDSKKNL